MSDRSCSDYRLSGSRIQGREGGGEEHGEGWALVVAIELGFGGGERPPPNIKEFRGGSGWLHGGWRAGPEGASCQ
jgi:hypothetical protein